MNKVFSPKKGFTLIELLVVVAIIGILASIILLNLNTARGRANDTKVKGQLSQFRGAAELYYGGQLPNSYDGFCQSQEATKLMDQNNYPDGIAPECKASSQAWAVSHPWVSDPTKSFCVDSSGAVLDDGSVIDTDSFSCSVE